ncbi:MAG TPA: hypothetical protein DCK99_10645 [Blastocatellia bacterium]|nr:hypothetical protein [Blastocatellia bacterium]
MSCLFAVCFFRVAFLFFRVVAFDLDFAFGLLIPGMLDISCCARTGRLATHRKTANRSARTLTRNVKLNVVTLFMVTPRKEFQTKEDSQGKASLQPEAKD